MTLYAIYGYTKANRISKHNLQEVLVDMDFDEIIKRLQRDSDFVSECTKTFRSAMTQSGVPLAIEEYTCQENWLRFPKTFIATSSEHEGIYAAGFFDLRTEAFIIAGVHGKEAFYEQKLVEIAEFSAKVESPNGIACNQAYLGDSKKRYAPENAPENGIVFCKRYAQANFSDSCTELASFLTYILKEQSTN